MPNERDVTNCPKTYPSDLNAAPATCGHEFVHVLQNSAQVAATLSVPSVRSYVIKSPCPCSLGLITMPGCSSRIRSIEITLLPLGIGGFPSNQSRSILPY